MSWERPGGHRQGTHRCLGQHLAAGGAAAFLWSDQCLLQLASGYGITQAVKTLQKMHHLGLLAQREAPQCQAFGLVVQFQRAHSGMVNQAQLQLGCQGPGLPCAIGVFANDALVRQCQQP